MFRSFLTTYMLLKLTPTAKSCIGLGCLGVGCIPSPCFLGLCLQTPMIQPLGCPCRMGFSCVSGGCATRAAAAAAKTFHDDSVEQDESERNVDSRAKTPDEHFETCCTLLDVPQTCSNFCSYEGYNASAVQNSLLLASRCPLTELTKIHFCASRGVDHTKCCENMQIPTNCYVFCDQRPGNTSQLSFDHLQCMNQFDDIKGCFVEHALQEYYDETHLAIGNIALQEDTSAGMHFSR